MSKKFDDELKHYGTPRHSGRYPWGSGKNPQHHRGTSAKVAELKAKGITRPADIAKALGMSINDYKARISVEAEKAKNAEMAAVFRLKEKGFSTAAIAKKLDIPYTTVASRLKQKTEPTEKVKKNNVQETMDVLKKSVDDSRAGLIDVGKGVARNLGITDSRLDTAVKALEQEGYVKKKLQIKQQTGAGYTAMSVLAKPGMTGKEIFDKMGEVDLPYYYSQDNGHTFAKKQPIVNINSKRVYIRYNEDGGLDRDGTIELRRGVPDLDLCNARYAQVRIGVDGTHYLKGMAMYSDNVPDGYDIIYNTNKHRGTPPEKVFKAQKTDKDGNIIQEAPFGSATKEEKDLRLINRYYIDKDGKKKQSALNIVNEEGDWGEWSKKIASQMLAKQDPSLAKKQLRITADIKKQQFDDIMKLNNPIIKKQLLQEFSDECDSDAVYLKAAGFPRQRTHCILPFPKMKENEIYAPNYEDGEEVVLIRYPHGGIFEIPRLRVNNKLKAPKEVIGNAKDAVGINPRVAEQLSGADFDGDTVVVIPTKNVKIKNKSPLEGLKGFDTKEAYPYVEGMKVLGNQQKQREMGKVTNLITDMTIKGASDDEVCRATRFSMVIIDAEKHKLNWQQAYKDNDIRELKKKYQPEGGVSTLLSAAKNPERVTKRKQYYKIDPETGEKIFMEADDAHWIKKATGEKMTRTTESTKMYEAKDARTLSSGTRIEEIYADYANEMKALGNRARLESVRVEKWDYNKTAAEKYAPQVDSLKSKLNTALKNAPLERQANIITNMKVQSFKENNPEADKDEIKKYAGKQLSAARIQVGAKKQQIYITDDEWDAIQHHAIHKSTMEDIIANADSDRLKSLATPKQSRTVSASTQTKIKQLAKNGYTQEEIASWLGISTSTVNEYLV